eukprot:EG_transcript_4850
MSPRAKPAGSRPDRSQPRHRQQPPIHTDTPQPTDPSLLQRLQGTFGCSSTGSSPTTSPRGRAAKPAGSYPDRSQPPHPPESNPAGSAVLRAVRGCLRRSPTAPALKAPPRPAPAGSPPRGREVPAAVRDAVLLAVVEGRPRGLFHLQSSWVPAVLGIGSVLALVFMGSVHGPAPGPPPCGDSTAPSAETCHADSGAAAVGCVFGEAAEELVNSVSKPASQRQGCQSACTLTEYAEASPLNRDLLVSHGAVAAVVGRLTALGQDDRPTALGLLGSLRPLCINSSLAQKAIRAVGGMQALMGLSQRFSNDPFVLSTIIGLQQLLFPAVPSESPSLSPSPSPSPSGSPSPSLSPSPS